MKKQERKKVMKGKTSNPWMDHVKKCKGMKKNQGKSLKDILKDASATYKKND